MRRQDKEITDRETMESIIRKAQVCRLALCDGGVPYIVPLNFGYRDNCLYIHSATEGRKLEILRRNNAVCFEMETDCEIVRNEIACRWGMKYRSVIGFGKAYFLESPGDKAAALDIIMSQYAEGSFSYPLAMLDKVAVIKITVESMTGKKSGY